MPLPPTRVDPRRALRWNGSLHPLLSEIEAFQREHRLSDAVFGVRATGDPGLVTQMRQGRWPRAVTVARVRAWMLRQAQDERPFETPPAAAPQGERV